MERSINRSIVFAKLENAIPVLIEFGKGFIRQVLYDRNSKQEFHIVFSRSMTDHIVYEYNNGAIKKGTLKQIKEKEYNLDYKLL